MIRPVSEAAYDGDVRALSAELKGALAGEVRFDTGSRALYATDLSIYRQVPIGVVIPRDVDDVIAAVEICRKYHAPLVSRGCGTSLAGQTCNTAVVLDFSKYMNRVLEIDPSRKTALVEPGVINDTLRQSAERYRLTFGPDPATHSYCTIGGMIGNNSCGVHSVRWGKTVDNVNELDILTYDGLRMRVASASDSVVGQIGKGSGRRSAIYRDLRDLGKRSAELVRSRFPKIPRRVSGYNLDQLLPENGFNVARALVGSEGTCVIVLRATLDLVESPPFRTLIVIGYPDVFRLADAVPYVREFKPLGLEGFEAHVIENLERKGIDVPASKLLPHGQCWMLVEFGGDSQAEATSVARSAVDKIRRHDRTLLGIELFDTAGEQGKIWHVRESGVAASRVPGVEESWPSWEDAAVAPEKLGGYLREFAKLVDDYRYKWTLFGHFGDGCVHTRISFDLKTAPGVQQFRSFMTNAADLVVSYGGSLSGEHGDGEAKGELLPKMFGPELMRAFHDFKQIWDPQWKMNPGKVVDPFPLDRNLREGPEYKPAAVKTHFHFPDDHGSFAAAAERCFGVGKCRSLTGGTMCPSFRATREEMHSTRGRAHLLFEMMRGDELGRGWRSPHVREALDLCLSCKGCKSDCPVSVDMATYKAEFLSHYYRGRLRPASAYAMGLIQVWAGLARLAPDLVNAATHIAPFDAIAKWFGGITQQRELPRFASRTFTQWFERRPRQNGNAQRVVLWPDTFTNNFEPEVARAAVEALESAGYAVSIPDNPVCCGRPLYEYGMLGRARRYGRRNLHVLRDALAADLPIVVLEPSCLSVFKDEMVNLFPDDPDATKLARNSYSLDDFLIERLDYEPPHFARTAIVHGHCHQKALGGIDSELKLLHRMGMQTQTPDSGCCGLAGSFGYEAGHYDVSMKIGEHVLLPKVREADDDTLIVSSGFSCREQIQHGTGRVAIHPAQVVQMALRQHARRPAVPATRDAHRTRRAIVAEAAVGIALVATVAGLVYSRQSHLG